MFCLFKNSHLTPKVNFFVAAISWIAALAWLNFTFIEKELVLKVIAGEAILLDLLLGIPLVLMLAVVVYATVFWFIKLIIVYLFPRAIAPASEYDSQSELLEDPDLEETLQKQYGENYWQNRDNNFQIEDPVDTKKVAEQSELSKDNRTETKLQSESRPQAKTDKNKI